MDLDGLVADLLALDDPGQRQTWLQDNRGTIDLDFIQALKAQVEAHKLRDPQQAGEIAGLALEAATLSDDPLAISLARWSQGNVFLYTGDFRQAVQAYRSAEAAYAAAGDHLSVARLQTNRVFALTCLGQHRQALELAQSAREALTRAGHAEDVYMAVLEMNVGVALRQSGRYEGALAAYERGRALFEGLGNTVQVARIDINRSKVLEKLDRFQEAAALLQSARDTLSSEGIALDVARADLNLAHLAFRRGRYRHAFQAYLQAREALAGLGEEMEVAAVDYYRSQVYWELGLWAEAEQLAGRARAVFLERGMQRYAAQAAVVQGAARHGLGDIASAQEILGQARSALAGRGESLEVALIDLRRAALLRQSGQAEAALDLARQTAGLLGDRTPIRLAQAHLIAADALLDLGQVAAAGPLYQAVYQVAVDENLPTLAGRADYGLGRLTEAEDDVERAAQHYATAIDRIEAVHRDLRIDEFQTAFMDTHLEIYEAAVRLALDRGEIELAFAYTERARSGALLDLLAHGLELTGAEGEEWLSRLQTLREQWHWHVSRRPEIDPDDESPPARAGRPERSPALQEIEQELSDAWRQLFLQQNRYGEIVRRGRLTLGQVQEHLPEESALVQYALVEDRFVAFVVDRQGYDLVELPGMASQVERLIVLWRFDLDSLHLQPDPALSGGTAAAEAESLFYLQHLYEALFAPLAGRLEPYPHLVVVPDQVLHHLPLAALHDGHAYLGERWSVSYLPAASLLGKPTPAGQPLAGGRPQSPLILAYSDRERLPYIVKEARQVAAVLDGAGLFLEDEATIERLRERGPDCSLLHLAAHGAFRADNPLFSWLRLADGRLTVHDLYRLNLPAAGLVTLSACETGRTGLRGGDVLGLSYGFLATGARSLLLSLWSVDDQPTAELMVHFYRNLAAGQSKATALARAQQQVRSRHTHPFYWAGFILVGEPGEMEV